MTTDGPSLPQREGGISDADLTQALREFAQTDEGRRWIASLDLPERLPEVYGPGPTSGGSGSERDNDNGWCLGVVWDDNDQPLSGQIEKGQGEIAEHVCEQVFDSTFVNARYIAAVSPDVVLTLLAELDRPDLLAARRDALTARLSGWCYCSEVESDDLATLLCSKCGNQIKPVGGGV